MAAEAPDVIHERILARAPPRSLRKSCNGVLQSEISDVSARLREVAEAFRRMKEVEAAVTQLQQDKGDRRRSASLMALIADVGRVQSSLHKKLQLMNCAFPGALVESNAVSCVGDA